MPDDRTPERPDTPDAPAGSRTVVQQRPPHWLAESNADATHPDAVRSTSAERYELLEEIARGGMGVVYRARDQLLNREVGVKTLLQVPREESAVASRFRSEAHITGQLQHPNIPPVHDLGTLPDGRPFLAMKLIKGRTLDAMLKKRPDPSHERGKYLAIFEQIAQAVAYAHAHRVLHRDLKPLNVMVGAFGEVQVMDWGLAKVLTDGPAKTAVSPSVETAGTPVKVAVSSAETAAGTDIRLSRDGTDETRPGSIFGTPSYMPREQAVGAVDQIDARSDVFSLGGILCAVLTGKPPYVGADAESTRQLAAAARLDDAFARLDACGAEQELVALCKRCLSAERGDRPKDANEVAHAVAELRAEAEKRARQAEMERAKAELQAAEQRKRRKVQLALFAVVTLLLCGGGAFAWWQDKQATERRFREEQTRQGVRAGMALAVDLRKQYKFKAAEAALVQSAELAQSGAPELLPEVEQAQRDLAFVVQLDDIRFRKWIWIGESGGDGDYNTKIASPEYRKAFADRGLDLLALDPAEAAKRIAASNVKADLVAAVDDWALYEPDEVVCNRLLVIGRLADPGEWTSRLRDPTLRRDPSTWGSRVLMTVALTQLANDADPGITSPAALSVLAELMERNDLDPSGLLSAARVKHPTAFELAFALGQRHHRSPDALEIGPYEAARALRPENLAVWGNLASALAGKGQWDEAIAAFQQVVKLNPKDARAYRNLGVALKAKGQLDKAIAAYRQAIQLDHKYAAAYLNLGVALRAKGQLDEAIAAYKGAIQLDHKYAKAHFNLGLALQVKGQRGEAIAAFQQVVKIDPKHAGAYHNLGIALQAKGQLEEAIAAYRQAIQLDPKDARAYLNLGNALMHKGQLDEAHAAFQRVIQLDPKNAKGYYNLGVVLKGKGQLDGAIAAYKQAVELDPKDTKAHFNMGVVYLDQKQYAEAVACARAATNADPKLADAHAMLGHALQQTGDIPGARAALTEAARLDKRWASMLAKLPPLDVAPPPREVKRR